MKKYSPEALAKAALLNAKCKEGLSTPLPTKSAGLFGKPADYVSPRVAALRAKRGASNVTPILRRPATQHIPSVWDGMSQRDHSTLARKPAKPVNDKSIVDQMREAMEAGQKFLEKNT